MVRDLVKRFGQVDVGKGAPHARGEWSRTEAVKNLLCSDTGAQSVGMLQSALHLDVRPIEGPRTLVASKPSRQSQAEMIFVSPMIFASPHCCVRPS